VLELGLGVCSLEVLVVVPVFFSCTLFGYGSHRLTEQLLKSWPALTFCSSHHFHDAHAVFPLSTHDTDNIFIFIFILFCLSL
jgi:hypothetical protein